MFVAPAVVSVGAPVDTPVDVLADVLAATLLGTGTVPPAINGWKASMRKHIISKALRTFGKTGKSRMPLTAIW